MAVGKLSTLESDFLKVSHLISASMNMETYLARDSANVIKVKILRDEMIL